MFEVVDQIRDEERYDAQLLQLLQQVDDGQKVVFGLERVNFVLLTVVFARFEITSGHLCVSEVL